DDSRQVEVLLGVPTRKTGEIIGKGNVPMPERLKEFMKGEKKTVEIGTGFEEFRNYLLSVES
ncbi:MAG: hypothetical protein WCF65_09455, partial [Parachlamydiaceae bacterium]